MIKRFLLRDKARILTRSVAIDMFLSQYVTEKTSSLMQNKALVFKVTKDANKIDIKRAFEMVFQIKAESVRTMNVKSGIKHFKGQKYVKATYKKAIIQLSKDFDLSQIQGLDQ